MQPSQQSATVDLSEAAANDHLLLHPSVLVGACQLGAVHASAQRQPLLVTASLSALLVPFSASTAGTAGKCWAVAQADVANSHTSSSTDLSIMGCAEQPLVQLHNLVAREMALATPGKQQSATLAAAAAGDNMLNQTVWVADSVPPYHPLQANAASISMAGKQTTALSTYGGALGLLHGLAVHADSSSNPLAAMLSATGSVEVAASGLKQQVGNALLTSAGRCGCHKAGVPFDRWTVDGQIKVRCVHTTHCD